MSENLTASRQWATRLLVSASVVVVLIAPLYLDQFWLQLGFFCFAAAVGTLGLNLLTGIAGLLSLAHGFFLAVGAYAYVFLAGGSEEGISGALVGAGLPSWLAAILAVGVAGFAGLLFSPISGRLRGIYLGVASLALIFIGQHVLHNYESVTGGFYGRDVPTLSLFGFTFAETDPVLMVLGVPFGREERLWYLGAAILLVAYVFARNIVAGRTGRAMQLVRDNEVAASSMGIDVRHYKASAFVLSSIYAGAAGVLIVLALGRAVPDYFGLALSISYLIMVVIGGLGSLPGSVAGAFFVVALPEVLNHYATSLPFLSQPGGDGVSAVQFSEYLYGLLVVAVILFIPRGLAGVFASVRGRAAPRSAPASDGAQLEPQSSERPHLPA
ncbi:branched-chain amino acid ABC transporter permease [Nocardioides endophyticus]|uniref:Branched-chain amino acid ABC transporter permease n=1 Tax=Nocardioides endophyticus TaxID=1353775 RepID=A0ABP8ZD81_9ACTN